MTVVSVVTVSVVTVSVVTVSVSVVTVVTVSVSVVTVVTVSVVTVVIVTVVIVSDCEWLLWLLWLLWLADKEPERKRSFPGDGSKPPHNLIKPQKNPPHCLAALKPLVIRLLGTQTV